MTDKQMQEKDRADFQACKDANPQRYVELAEPIVGKDVVTDPAIDAAFKQDCLTDMSNPEEWNETTLLCMRFARKFYEQGWQAARRSQGREAPEWLPIESAPKDGRRLILLLTPSGWPQVAYSNTWWTSGFSVECKPTYWAPIAAAPGKGEEG